MERIVVCAEYNCGNERNCVPFQNIFDGFKNINPFDAELYKYNLNALNKFFEYMSNFMLNCYRNYCDIFERFADQNNFSCCNKLSGDCGKNDNEFILPAGGRDIINYLIRHNMKNNQVQAVMKLNGKLDFDRLKKAVRMSVDAVPVLGCRFVEDDPPYWKRLGNIDEIAFCEMEEIDYASEAVKSFLQSPLDMDNDPMLKVKIIRTSQNDILGVKINQTCCDGTGIKEYIQLLSKIYSSPDQKGGAFIPAPGGDVGYSRGKVFRELAEVFPDIRWNPKPEVKKAMWSFPWIQRGGDSVLFAICRFPKGSINAMYQYGKQKGATLSDLILTAFYRVMFKTSMPRYGVPMDIFLNVDLRNFLPEQKSHDIRNLSGGLITRVPRVMNESFEETLSRVVKQTKKINKRHAAESPAASEESTENVQVTYFNNYYELMSQASEIASQSPNYIGNVCFPGFCDIGDISESLITFGNNIVTDAYIIPPVIRAPGLLLFASRYNGVLTLSVGYSRNSVSQRFIEGLLNKIKYELIKECKCNVIDEG